MAYFSNGSEGIVFDDQCAKCKFGKSPCPIAFVQIEYNYAQLSDTTGTTRKILDHLVSATGECAVFNMAKSDFEIGKSMEYNRTIADFMNLCKHPSGNYITDKGVLHPNDLGYHYSWDWLMPVVERINSIKHPVYLYGSHIQRSCTVFQLGVDDSDSRLVSNSDVVLSLIDITYKSVVEFVKWYNEQRKEAL